MPRRWEADSNYSRKTWARQWEELSFFKTTAFFPRFFGKVALWTQYRPEQMRVLPGGVRKESRWSKLDFSPYPRFCGASLAAQMVKNLPAMKETRVWFLGQEDPLEKGMATRSSILAWRTSWTEEPGRLQSMELQRVRHHWVTNIFTFYLDFYGTHSTWGVALGEYFWCKWRLTVSLLTRYFNGRNRKAWT